MENWKLEYYGKLLKKFPNNKYQLAITCLFLFDNDLLDYQPFTEYSVDLAEKIDNAVMSDSDNSRRRIDLFYKHSNIAIEIDEQHHNENDDINRENQIKKEIQGIQFHRINIANHEWHQRFLEIKKEILKTKATEWNESDVVAGFKQLNVIDVKAIGNQINAITKYYYGSFATFTSPDRYSGVYINDDKGNNPGNYYIAVVCYAEDTSESAAKVSFMVYSQKVIDALKQDNTWFKANKTVPSVFRTFDIDANYLDSIKETQFKKLSQFITANFDAVHPIDSRVFKDENPDDGDL
jgi:hypothetical protein